MTFSNVDAENDHADNERLVLAAAQTLLDNGEDTTGVISTVDRMSNALHLGVAASLGWGEMTLRSRDRLVGITQTNPWNVNMRRVIATLEATAAINEGRLRGAAAEAALRDAAARPAYGLVPFALVCAIGAAALSIINGASHPTVLGIVACSALLGAFVRRGLGALGANPLAQLFFASLLAGLVGAAAARFHVAFKTGLVALGPLFVLVPGPALLGGAFDAVGLRIPLGLSRFTYGVLSIVALSAGVIIGVELVGGSGVTERMPMTSISLWLDMLCAGLASVAYGIFFSMPSRTLVYPTIMGLIAHGLRWFCLNDLRLSNACAAGLACLFVGVVMEPLSRRLRLPFAAVGFASVVAQVPGSYLFRMSAGLATLQQHGAHASVDLLAGILSDGGTALLTLVTMTIGLVLPKSVYMLFDTPKLAK